jgi:hypothetical protein
MVSVTTTVKCGATDSVYVGEKTLVVPADAVERYRRLHPEVSEVLTAAELPVEEQTTRSREQIIFEASTHTNLKLHIRKTHVVINHQDLFKRLKQCRI